MEDLISTLMSDFLRTCRESLLILHLATFSNEAYYSFKSTLMHRCPHVYLECSSRQSLTHLGPYLPFSEEGNKRVLILALFSTFSLKWIFIHHESVYPILGDRASYSLWTSAILQAIYVIVGRTLKCQNFILCLNLKAEAYRRQNFIMHFSSV